MYCKSRNTIHIQEDYEHIEIYRNHGTDGADLQVLQVMREADLYEDVMKKPKGVATDATELSGGEPRKFWQTICREIPE